VYGRYHRCRLDCHFSASMGSQFSVGKVETAQKFLCCQRGEYLPSPLLSPTIANLREMNLDHNARVITAGWVAFSAVLCHPNSALESLDMTQFYQRRSSVFISRSIVYKNSRPRKLYFSIDTSEINSITSDGYVAMARILCNNSSILSTFNSNHTLET